MRQSVLSCLANGRFRSEILETLNDRAATSHFRTRFQQKLEQVVAVSASSRKKAIVRKFSRDWQTGYVSPQGFARSGQLEILDMSGKVLTISLEEIKWVCFVREFSAGDDPERLMRRTFTSRPRTPGVWLRMKLRDGEEIEGLASNDATLLDPEGILFTPPDMRSSTQRVFVPRAALQSLEIVAVIHPRRRRRVHPDEQEGLFAG